MGTDVQTDANGKIIEDLLDKKELVCLNDVRGTRINLQTGIESALDLTLVLNTMAGDSKWEVWSATTVRSDYYPVLCMVGGRMGVRIEGRIPKWIFEKADWDKFQKISDETVARIDVSGSIHYQVTSAIIIAAEEAIPKGRNRGNWKLVPWWNEECHQAVRNSRSIQIS